ncbi:MAG: hypothetical protein JO353_05230 [Phycisphaerae bacterium]|nr:hypothetical protein [Phycisphaerae bacterium]
MSDRAVQLDEQHFRILSENAAAFGTTPELYLQSLIDAHSRTFDEILSPIRAGFEQMSDEEIDGLFDQARKAARPV